MTSSVLWLAFKGYKGAGSAARFSRLTDDALFFVVQCLPVLRRAARRRPVRVAARTQRPIRSRVRLLLRRPNESREQVFGAYLTSEWGSTAASWSGKK
ncbi:hypothetical protein MTO96_030993 [Rhipicephalus appendiculatus]